MIARQIDERRQRYLEENGRPRAPQSLNVPAVPGGYIHDQQERIQAANDLLMQGYRRALPLNNPASTRNRRDPTGQGREARFGPDDAERAQITPATPRVPRRREGYPDGIDAFRDLDPSDPQSLDPDSSDYKRAVARGTRATQSQAAMTIQQAVLREL